MPNIREKASKQAGRQQGWEEKGKKNPQTKISAHLIQFSILKPDLPLKIPVCSRFAELARFYGFYRRAECNAPPCPLVSPTQVNKGTACEVGTQNPVSLALRLIFPVEPRRPLCFGQS